MERIDDVIVFHFKVPWALVTFNALGIEGKLEALGVNFVLASPSLEDAVELGARFHL